MATSVTAFPRTTRGRVLALCLALVATLLTGVAASADHDRTGEPVDGVQQSYTSGRAGTTAVVTPTLFLAGTETDQADKTLDPTAPTFSEDEPSGTTITQETSPFANPEVPADPLAAFWSGEFTGDVAGDLQLNWFFSSANPIPLLIGAQSEVTVFADPDLSSGSTAQPEKIIGRAMVDLNVGATSTPNTTVVPVEGTVNERLLIQVVPVFSDSGQDLRAEYGSAASPSGFSLVSGGDAGGTPARPSVDAPYGGEPFTVQAVPVGREALEPTIGVDRDGVAFVAAGTFDSVIGQARTEILRSTDGGLNWESIQPILGDVTTNPPGTLDPYVYVEEDSGRVFSIDLLVACANLLFSDDQGDSFQQNQAACGEFVNDHQTLFAGPPPVGNPAVQPTDPDFPEILYYCFNRIADSDCGRSVNGGRTFTPTVGEPAFLGFDPEAGGFCGGLHGHIATDFEGRIFLPKGHCGFPWVSVSEDGGQSWTQVQVSDQVSAAGIQTHVATDAAGNVYYVWWDAEERLPYMAVSTDHGMTWGEPRMIAPPGVSEVNWPSVAAGDDGRVTIYFPGTTVDDREDKTRPWNIYVVATENALDPEPLFVSTTANPVSDPIHRGDCLGRCAGMFDFLDVIVSPHDGDIWAAATDTCTDVMECNSNANAQGNGGQGSTARARDGIAIRQLSGPSMIDTGEQPTEVPTTPPTETPSEVPDEEPEVSRVEGGGRVETAIEVSRAAFDSADTVVLARMDDYPDALAASGLAAEVDAPVLLTATEGLDPLVAEEIERLGATDTYLMGGVEALSPQVEGDLDDAGVEHERIGGFERFETAALIADEIVSLGGPVDQVVLALGGRGGGLDAWPDALAAGNLAAAGRAPIVLTTPDDLPEVTSEALDRLVGDGDRLFLAGGTEAIDAEQERSVADRGFAVTRLGGADRYGTAVAIVEEARRQGADADPLLLASGEIFADALVAAPAARRLGGSLLLVHPEDLDSSAATGQFLEDNRDRLDRVLVVGGSDTVADRVVDQVEESQTGG